MNSSQSIDALKLFSILIGIFLSGCSPKIYLIDRQTVLEDEAAGEWPDFEKDILEQSKATGPTAFSKTGESIQKKRLYQVLNGELTSQNSSNGSVQTKNNSNQNQSIPASQQ